MSSNNMIRLNVGGVVFMTSLSTLQSCPTSSLALMFSPSSPHQLPPRDSSGDFFLDSSPAMFGYVLDWCRYNQLLVDRVNMDWGGLEVVADYFGLEDMKQEIRQRREQQQEKERLKKADTVERYRELVETIAQIRGDLAQLAQSMQNGGGVVGHPRPGGPRPPFYPDPDYPFTQY